MRPINLLPARYQPVRASGDRPGIGYAALAVLGVLLVMVLLYVVTNNGIKDAKSKTADAQAEQQAAQARIGQLQAYGDFTSLKTSREAAVKGVASARFDYERLMREIALLLPHNTYLTNLAAGVGGSTADAATTTVSATGPVVNITGCAPSHPGVTTALVGLRKLHSVTDVNLTSSAKRAASGTDGSAGCPVNWTAALTFQPEASQPVTGPVPAR